MSGAIYEKSFSLEVKTRGQQETDFVEPVYRLPASCLPNYVAQGGRVVLRVTIEEKHTWPEYARAYARQGAADLQVYGELVKLRKGGVIKEDCHELHYLQMALEKIGRAYLLQHVRGDRSAYLSTHVAAAEFVKRYTQSPEGQARFSGKDWARQGVKQLAGAIEEFTPAVERQARPANFEYPWSDGMTLTVPRDVDFHARLGGIAANVWQELVDLLDDVSKALSK